MLSGAGKVPRTLGGVLVLMFELSRSYLLVASGGDEEINSSLA